MNVTADLVAEVVERVIPHIAFDLRPDVLAAMERAAAAEEELSEAKRLVSARDEFIGNAKREAESIRKNAEDKARAMLEEQEIVRVAKAHSAQLVSDAEYKSKELRRVANEYVDEILRRTEETVGSALKSINQSRVSFRSLSGAAPAAPAAPVAEVKAEE